MIELDDPVSDHQRIVIGQRDDTGAEADVLRALGGSGDEDFGRTDDFDAGGVMLAHPCFVKAEPVEILAQFEVAMQ